MSASRLRIMVAVAATSVSIGGCQAYDQADRATQAYQRAKDQLQHAADQARTAGTKLQSGEQSARKSVSDAQQQFGSSGDESSYADGCPLPSTDSYTSTDTFLSEALNVAGKDDPKVSAALGAAQALDVSLFYVRLGKLAKGDVGQQRGTTCVLDRFYSSLSASDRDTVDHSALLYNESGDWFQLTADEKFKLAACLCTPLSKIVTRIVISGAPKGP